MRISMMTDLEGVVAFEDRRDTSSENQRTRGRMRRLLTGEVNAAIAELFDGGATEITVNDGYGTGYTIDFEELDPRVQIIHSTDRPFWLPLLDCTCDATVLVGAHAKGGPAGATSYHTVSISIKGVSLGEMGLQALIAEHYGVPMIFVRGEGHACREDRGVDPGDRDRGGQERTITI